MKLKLDFLSKTIKGGLFFLVPVTLVVVLMGKVLNLLKPVGHFISGIVDKDDTLRFDLAYIITVLALVLICFLCGLLAASRAGKAFAGWIEDNILVMFPGYHYIKNTTQAASGLESGQNYPVVLVMVDGWMIGFLMDELPGNIAVVFVPGSPNPWSGDVMMFDKSEIKHTSLTQKEALSFLRRTGIGLGDLKIR